jgi:hypothetical protein
VDAGADATPRGGWSRAGRRRAEPTAQDARRFEREHLAEVHLPSGEHSDAAPSGPTCRPVIPSDAPMTVKARVGLRGAGRAGGRRSGPGSVGSRGWSCLGPPPLCVGAGRWVRAQPGQDHQVQGLVELAVPSAVEAPSAPPEGAGQGGPQHRARRPAVGGRGGRAVPPLRARLRHRDTGQQCTCRTDTRRTDCQDHQARAHQPGGGNRDPHRRAGQHLGRGANGYRDQRPAHNPAPESGNPDLGRAPDTSVIESEQDRRDARDALSATTSEPVEPNASQSPTPRSMPWFRPRTGRASRSIRNRTGLVTMTGSVTKATRSTEPSSSY